MYKEHMLLRLMEDKVLLAEGRKRRVAFVGAELDVGNMPTFNMDPSKASINFGVLRRMDPTFKAYQGLAGTTRLVTRRNPIIAAGVDLLQTTHPGHNIRMTEDILSFEPDEELINMSANPLWVIEPKTANEVIIKRIF